LRIEVKKEMANLYFCMSCGNTGATKKCATCNSYLTNLMHNTGVVRTTANGTAKGICKGTSVQSV
jgi:hypothetical protein